MGGSRM